MKTSIAIAAYFGRRDQTHTEYMKDYLFFVKTHISVLSDSSIYDKLHKIYFVCTDDGTGDTEYINSYLFEIMEKYSKVVILNRPNVGGSYAGWHNVLEFDNNDSDYMIFCEDDYVIHPMAPENMLEYYQETPDMIYLCQLWNKNRYTKDGVDIMEHAQMAGGMLNVKLYNKLYNERGMDFTLYYFPGKVAIYNNQASFLERYRQAGIPIRDMHEKYACIYNNDKNSVINFGKPDGIDIFRPINDWYPNQCPNLRYTW